MPFRAVSIRGHTPLHTAFQPSKHSLKSFCYASAYSSRVVCFVSRREQTGVAGSFVQDHKQFGDFFKQWWQQVNKTYYKEIITWHYVDATKSGLASD
jgi:hypothetical protein